METSIIQGKTAPSLYWIREFFLELTEDRVTKLFLTSSQFGRNFIFQVFDCSKQKRHIAAHQKIENLDSLMMELLRSLKINRLLQCQLVDWLA